MPTIIKPKKPTKTKFTVMFVCTGNTCRSPMAEFMFKQYLKDKKRSGEFTVSSAGLYAERGTVMSEQAEQALTFLNVPFKPERKARIFTAAMSHDTDLIIGMTAAHAAECGGNAVSFESITGMPISDPYGCPLRVYLECAAQIRAAFDKILEMCDKLMQN